jgi:hypothetical protein
VIGFINYNPHIVEADRMGVNVFDISPDAVEEARGIKERLELSIEKINSRRES